MAAEEHVDDFYDIESANLPQESDVFLLRVKGNSMTGDDIADGDLVVVCRQQIPETNAIVVAYLEDQGEAAIKRIEQTAKGDVRLVSSNPSYPPIPVLVPSALRVHGCVLGILRGETVFS